MNRKVLITGGHMTPALAVMDRLRQLGVKEFVWVGHKYSQVGASDVSQEFKTINKFNDTKFIDLRTGKIVRSWKESISDLALFCKNLMRIPWGFIKAFWIVLRFRPKVVMSFGGYLAVPVVMAAWVLGVPIYTHEQTVTTGLANKVIARFARAVFVSWESSLAHYRPGKALVTGNPIRSQVLHSQTSAINFDEKLPIVYVTGGNQGAYKINAAVIAALPQLLNISNVIHQTGEALDTLNALETLDLAPEIAHRYIRRPYFASEVLGEIFSKSDLIIARAGANTVTEILALGKMTIFIPIPWVSHNEQYLNAKMVENVGLGKILTEQELSPTTLELHIEEALAAAAAGRAFNNQRLDSAAAAAKSLVKSDADIRIAEILWQTINR